jgi:hydrogenase expression/formation protein HypD
MKYLDEYRDGAALRKLADAIGRATTRPWVMMEVCGGQTHSIVRHALDQLLPSAIELLHGPGCPVCVIPVETIDRAHAIASKSGVIFCSFGDMLRVPGSRGDLLGLKAQGADIRVIYSPLDALRIAAAEPKREVVLFAIGFETTAPANATVAKLAQSRGLGNFSMLVAHVLVPPVLAALLEAPNNRVQAFLGPGHVCTVMGTRQYEDLVRAYGVPIVVTGFEPVDLLHGVLMTVLQLERGAQEVAVQYSRVVRPEGNPDARRILEEVFEVCDRKWRGMGSIENSGFRLNAAYRALDAEHRFEVLELVADESRECISGEVLKGLKKPTECAAFGKRCTPDSPLGATMVSTEGACAAYFAYRPPKAALPLVP